MPLTGPYPKPGDLIEFKRFGYQHWGIYVGDGQVVHLTDQEGWSSLSSAFGGTAVVKRESLEAVAAGCNYMVNNKYDKKATPYPSGKIVKAALEEVGKRKNYSVEDAKMYTAGGTAVVALGAVAAVMFTTMKRNHQHQ